MAYEQWEERYYRIMTEPSYTEKERTMFYRCGICECTHRWEWNGDCREDSERLNDEDIPWDAEILEWEDRMKADQED